MYMLLGQAGPPWYMEGMAELLATHHWQDGQLDGRLLSDQQPRSPQLGPDRNHSKRRWPPGTRRDARTTCSTLRGVDRRSITTSMAGRGGWPRFSTATRAIASVFARCPSCSAAGDFEAEFRRLFAADWDAAATPSGRPSWPASTMATISSGWRSTFDRASRSMAARAQAKIDVDHGWQSSRLRLEAGKTYELSASGRYQIGRRAGRLVVRAGRRDDSLLSRPAAGNSAGRRAIAGRRRRRRRADPSDRPRVGQRSVGQADSSSDWARRSRRPQSGTLYLRVNEPAGELADNSGTRRPRWFARSRPRKPLSRLRERARCRPSRLTRRGIGV